jgi:hypothetical protein
VNVLWGRRRPHGEPDPAEVGCGRWCSHTQPMFVRREDAVNRMGSARRARAKRAALARSPWRQGRWRDQRRYPVPPPCDFPRGSDPLATPSNFPLDPPISGADQGDGIAARTKLKRRMSPPPPTTQLGREWGHRRYSWGRCGEPSCNGQEVAPDLRWGRGMTRRP